MAKVLVIGLNPALQTILELAPFNLGQVNRARSVNKLASGKGINTAKVLARLGHDVWLLQILGGHAGRLCLKGCESWGIHSVDAWADEETRQCITLLDSNTRQLATEIIEPFSISNPNLDQDLLRQLPTDPDAFTALVFCGSIPKGLSPTIFAEVRSRYTAKVSVVDAWQGVNAEFLAKATCIKVNMTEFADMQKSPETNSHALENQLFALTAGSGEAQLVKGQTVLGRYKPPLLARAINPIGAGDTVTAGLIHFLLFGLPAQEAFRRALAMGSASCLKLLPAEYSGEDYLRLLPEVERIHG